MRDAQQRDVIENLEKALNVGENKTGTPSYNTTTHIPVVLWDFHMAVEKLLDVQEGLGNPREGFGSLSDRDKADCFIAANIVQSVLAKADSQLSVDYHTMYDIAGPAMLDVGEMCGAALEYYDGTEHSPEENEYLRDRAEDRLHQFYDEYGDKSNDNVDCPDFAHSWLRDENDRRDPMNMEIGHDRHSLEDGGMMGRAVRTVGPDQECFITSISRDKKIEMLGEYRKGTGELDTAKEENQRVDAWLSEVYASAADEVLANSDATGDEVKEACGWLEKSAALSGSTDTDRIEAAYSRAAGLYASENRFIDAYEASRHAGFSTETKLSYLDRGIYEALWENNLDEHADGFGVVVNAYENGEGDFIEAVRYSIDHIDSGYTMDPDEMAKIERLLEVRDAVAAGEDMPVEKPAADFRPDVDRPDPVSAEAPESAVAADATPVDTSVDNPPVTAESTPVDTGDADAGKDAAFDKDAITPEFIHEAADGYIDLLRDERIVDTICSVLGDDVAEHYKDLLVELASASVAGDKDTVDACADEIVDILRSVDPDLVDSGVSVPDAGGSVDLSDPGSSATPVDTSRDGEIYKELYDLGKTANIDPHTDRRINYQSRNPFQLYASANFCRYVRGIDKETYQRITGDEKPSNTLLNAGIALCTVNMVRAFTISNVSAVFSEALYQSFLKDAKDDKNDLVERGRSTVATRRYTNDIVAMLKDPDSAFCKDLKHEMGEEKFELFKNAMERYGANPMDKDALNEANRLVAKADFTVGGRGMNERFDRRDMVQNWNILKEAVQARREGREANITVAGIGTTKRPVSNMDVMWAAVNFLSNSDLLYTLGKAIYIEIQDVFFSIFDSRETASDLIDKAVDIKHTKDEQGRVITSDYPVYTDKDGATHKKLESYTYDGDSRAFLTKTETDRVTKSDGSYSDITSHFNSKNNLVDKSIESFDASGNKIGEEKITNGIDRDGVPTGFDQGTGYTIDSKGSRHDFNETWDKDGVHNRTEHITHKDGATEDKYNIDKNGKDIENHSDKYDADHNHIESRNFRAEVDADGNFTGASNENSFFIKDGVRHDIETETKADGSRTETHYAAYANGASRKDVTLYDSNHNMLEKTSEFFDKDGNKTGEQRVACDYDKNGNEIERRTETFDKDGNKIEEEKVTSDYDSKGNEIERHSEKYDKDNNLIEKKDLSVKVDADGIASKESISKEFRIDSKDDSRHDIERSTKADGSYTETERTTFKDGSYRIDVRHGDDVSKRVETTSEIFDKDDNKTGVEKSVSDYDKEDRLTGKNSEFFDKDGNKTGEGKLTLGYDINGKVIEKHSERVDQDGNLISKKDLSVKVDIKGAATQEKVISDFSRYKDGATKSEQSHYDSNGNLVEKTTDKTDKDGNPVSHEDLKAVVGKDGALSGEIEKSGFFTDKHGTVHDFNNIERPDGSRTERDQFVDEKGSTRDITREIATDGKTRLSENETKVTVDGTTFDIKRSYSDDGRHLSKADIVRHGTDGTEAHCERTYAIGSNGKDYMDSETIHYKDSIGRDHTLVQYYDEKGKELSYEDKLDTGELSEKDEEAIHSLFGSDDLSDILSIDDPEDPGAGDIDSSDPVVETTPANTESEADFNAVLAAIELDGTPVDERPDDAPDIYMSAAYALIGGDNPTGDDLKMAADWMEKAGADPGEVQAIHAKSCEAYLSAGDSYNAYKEAVAAKDQVGPEVKYDAIEAYAKDSLFEAKNDTGSPIRAARLFDMLPVERQQTPEAKEAFAKGAEAMERKKDATRSDLEKGVEWGHRTEGFSTEKINAMESRISGFKENYEVFSKELIKPVLQDAARTGDRVDFGKLYDGVQDALKPYSKILGEYTPRNFADDVRLGIAELREIGDAGDPKSENSIDNIDRLETDLEDFVEPFEKEAEDLEVSGVDRDERGA